MGRSPAFALLLALAALPALGGCAQILAYDDLGFEDGTGGKNSWTPVDASYEATFQDAPPPLNPECEQSSVTLIGDLAGTQFNECYARSWHTISQATTPATVDVEFGTQGKLHLEWTDLLIDGASVPAKGKLEIPSEGPNADKDYCVDAALFAMYEVELGVRVYTFSLTNLSSGTSCPGSAATGSLKGDFKTE